MTKKKSERKSPSVNSGNCISKEIQEQRPNAKGNAAKRKAWEKGKQFERIPIFRGVILREVKQEN